MVTTWFLSASKKTTASILFLSYLSKFAIYRYMADLDAGLSDLQIASAYTATLAGALLFAGMGILFRHKVANIFLICFIDIWIIANCLYFNSYNLYIDWQVIRLVDQLRGFESAILSFLDWKMIFVPLISILTFVFLFSMGTAVPSKSDRFVRFVPLVLASVFCFAATLSGNYASAHAVRDDTKWSLKDSEKTFVKMHSPAAHVVGVIFDALKDGLYTYQSTLPLTQREEEIMSSVYTGHTQPANHEINGHLVFILVESFESWTMKATDVAGKEVTGNLNKWIQENELLFCPDVISQQKYGRSGDGQLITQTGLLPLSSGVACMSYGDNTYPNFAHFFPCSFILNSYRGVWNQRVTTRSYGYKKLREPFLKQETDSAIFCRTRETLEQAGEPACVLVITGSTHAPFRSVPPTLHFAGYTASESNYLQCVHYMDRHLGRFLAWADTASLMKNSTVIITSDHNHFPVTEGKGKCVFIAKSPSIKSGKTIPQAYQMDVFPTVLHLIGQADYAWHGFGINLADSASTRLVSEKEAYVLSDKLIRSNYFEKHPCE